MPPGQGSWILLSGVEKLKNPDFRVVNFVDNEIILMNHKLPCALYSTGATNEWVLI
jgi:hypothetical protein